MKDLKRNFWHFFKKSWPLFVILAIVLLFFWKTIFKGLVPFPGDFVVGMYYPWLDYKWGYTVGVPVKNPITADVPSYIYPMQTMAMDMVKSGNLPLWNTRILAGLPLLANFQSAVLSPLNLYYLFLKNIDAWTWQIVSAHFLAAVFTYFLLREWKVGKLASIFGGMVFAFSGYNLIWSQWNGHTLSAALIPLMLLFEDRLLIGKKIICGVGFSLALCTQVFSGYPQTVVYSALAVGLLWLVRLFQNDQKIVSTLKLAIFSALGLGLAAVQILPGKELLRLSQWGAEFHTFEWAFLPWQKVITFLAPDFFGNHATGNYWGPQDYTSNTGFVGVAAIILSLFTLKIFKSNSWVRYAWLLVLVTLIISFPTPVSIFLWKYNLFGMAASSAHRALSLFDLGMALLAAFGFDLMLRKKIGFRTVAKALMIPMTLILGFGAFAYFKLDSSKYLVAIRNLILPGLVLVSTAVVLVLVIRFNQLKKIVAMAFFLLMIVEVFYFGWKFTPFSQRNLVFPETPVLTFLKSQQEPFRVTTNRVIPVNLAMIYGLESLEGYETMRPAALSQFLASLNKNNPNADPAGRYGIIDNDTSPLMDLVNTKYYLTLKSDKFGKPDPNGAIADKFDPNRFKIAFEDKTVTVLESKSVLPRAFMVYDWEVEKRGREILSKLLDPEFPLSQKIILEIVPSSSTVRTVEYNIKSQVKYLKYSDQESVIEVETERDGLLFVSDAYYPGWKAEIDGQVTKIYLADFAFRAVEVAQGKHEIKFYYQPESFFNGLTISTISLVIILAIIFLEKGGSRAILGKVK